LRVNHQKKKSKSQGQIKLKIFYPFNSRPSSNIVEEELKSVRDKYTFGDELGRGGFSIVYKGIKKDNGQEFAIKVIAKNQAEDDIAVLRREIEIMKKLKHKNIIQLYDVYEEDENIYIVVEIVTGGELFDHIISRGTYSERDAANIIRQVLEAVEFMHKSKIAHRDLKPENILVTGTNNDIVKVSDFGLSKDFGNDKLRTACGTPDYVAPEVLRGSTYDYTVDIWSIGVICYILLCGFPPFYGSSDQQIFDKILKCEYDFPSPDWNDISEDAKEFVSAILILDPNDRPNAEQCLCAPWIQNMAPSTELTHLSALNEKMAEYNEKRKKTINNVYELPKV